MTAPDIDLAEAPAGTPYVYFLLNEDRDVLYIGSTRHLRRRIAQHKRTKAWWSEVRVIRAFPHATLDAALAAEASYIGACNPLHNRKHLGPGKAGMVWALIAGEMPSVATMEALTFVNWVRRSSAEVTA